jgi:type IV secretory pathway VirB6-like protein
MKSYQDGTVIQSAIYPLYKATHPLFKHWEEDNSNQPIIHRVLLDIIDNQKSMWVDSFGYGLSIDNISIEKDVFQPILNNLTNIYFRKELNDIETHRELKQTFNPEIVVYYKSEFFKYLTIDELINKITELRQIYSKLVVYMDSTFIDYNRLKYPKKHVLSHLQDNLSGCKIEHYALNHILINI